MDTKTCTRCKETKSRLDFYTVVKKATGKRYAASYCKVCSAEVQRESHAKNPERRKRLWKNWYEKQDKATFQAKNRKSNARFKEACYAAYGGYRCACCGETEKKFLTLDHIKNDGSTMRKIHGDSRKFYLWLIRNQFPPIVEVSCFNCNLGKAVNGGVCPHKIRGGSEAIPQGSTSQANGDGSANPLPLKWSIQ